jgi:hypothetical protein
MTWPTRYYVLVWSFWSTHPSSFPDQSIIIFTLVVILAKQESAVQVLTWSISADQPSTFFFLRKRDLLGPHSHNNINKVDAKQRR